MIHAVRIARKHSRRKWWVQPLAFLPGHTCPSMPGKRVMTHRRPCWYWDRISRVRTWVRHVPQLTGLSIPRMLSAESGQKRACGSGWFPENCAWRRRRKCWNSGNLHKFKRDFSRIVVSWYLHVSFTKHTDLFFCRFEIDEWQYVYELRTLFPRSLVSFAYLT